MTIFTTDSNDVRHEKIWNLRRNQMKAVMLTRQASIWPLDQKVIEMLSIFSTSRPSPLYSFVS